MNIMADIVAPIRKKLAECKNALPARELARRAQACTLSHASFADALRGSGLNFIAELKKSSPSKGLIRADFDPAREAANLERAGAAALSVLTEEKFFTGSLQNLDAARTRAHLPLLRKDFIVDEYQIFEARLHGAAAVLLIAALLDGATLVRLGVEARALGLDVLLEVHNRRELDAVCALENFPIIGVNARDLKTFATDIHRAAELVSELPDDRIAVAESAIRTHGDVLALRDAGADAFLVGETIMRDDDPAAALRRLRGLES